MWRDKSISAKIESHKQNPWFYNVDPVENLFCDNWSDSGIENQMP